MTTWSPRYTILNFMMEERQAANEIMYVMFPVVYNPMQNSVHLCALRCQMNSCLWFTNDHMWPDLDQDCCMEVMLFHILSPVLFFSSKISPEASKEPHNDTIETNDIFKESIFGRKIIWK